MHNIWHYFIVFFYVQISVESFLDMACSIAVLGGGSNKEYALHILHKVNGNVKVMMANLILALDKLNPVLKACTGKRSLTTFSFVSRQDAVKLLLCQKYITQPGDPMYDYHYEGNAAELN